MFQISGYHDTIEWQITDGEQLVGRRHHDHDSLDRRGFRRFRFVQSFLVYCIVAVLSFAGGAGWQHQAHSVGRNSSFDYSHSNWLGSMAANGSHPSPDSSHNDFSPVRGWIRVYDSPPGIRRISRHAGHVRHEQHVKAAVVPAVQPVQPPSHYHNNYHGYYSCSMLERLWIREGGNPVYAFLAAEIATAESGGNPRIVSPTSDYGLWQINWSHDPMDPSVYLDPVVNARAAIAISSDGTDWSAWTTWVKGIYIGLC